jgi:hypothetical protein
MAALRALRTEHEFKLSAVRTALDYWCLLGIDDGRIPHSTQPTELAGLLFEKNSDSLGAMVDLGKLVTTRMFSGRESNNLT